jgi:hypothetical protein
MVTMLVNGVRREILAPADTPLLCVVRNDLELSGHDRIARIRCAKRGLSPASRLRSSSSSHAFARGITSRFRKRTISLYPDHNRLVDTTGWRKPYSRMLAATFATAAPFHLRAFLG